MAGYSIVNHPLFEEILIQGDLTVAVVREVVGELARSADFHQRHALWNFGQDVRPLAFHEFDDVIGLVEKVYARSPVRNKKVALVAEGSFVRSVAEMFTGQARTLPVTLRVFESVELARAWIEG